MRSSVAPGLRRDLRRALGTEATALLYHQHQAGTALATVVTDLAQVVNDNAKVLDTVNTLLGRGFVGRLRWLLLGK